MDNERNLILMADGQQPAPQQGISTQQFFAILSAVGDIILLTGAIVGGVKATKDTIDAIRGKKT
jgi:hypothetical protein